MAFRSSLRAETVKSPRSSRGRVRAAALAVIGGTICVLDTVAVESGGAAAWDRSAELDVHHDLPATLHGTFVALSTVGNGTPMVAVALLAALILVARRQWREATVVAIVPALALLVESIGKAVTHRTRPHLWPDAQVLHSYSYPSGHSTASMSVALVLIWLVWRYFGGVPRMAATLLGLAFAFAVGLSRVYLGVHWPTDVIGGEALALTAFAVLVVVVSAD